MICHYNKMVSCETPQKCGACGWNPVVAEARIAQLQAKLAADKQNESKEYDA